MGEGSGILESPLLCLICSHLEFFSQLHWYRFRILQSTALIQACDFSLFYSHQV